MIGGKSNDATEIFLKQQTFILVIFCHFLPHFNTNIPHGKIGNVKDHVGPKIYFWVNILIIGVEVPSKACETMGSPHNKGNTR
jgi:hypothetical protein